VQVNTSGEESKAGCDVAQVCGVARFVVEACPALRLVGLMTIGAVDSSPRPEAFRLLAECRERVQAEVGVDGLELSMGMSGDFERAIAMGGDSVRVGSTIFGAREYGSKA
jgi:PLP dependent protein